MASPIARSTPSSEGINLEVPDQRYLRAWVRIRCVWGGARGLCGTHAHPVERVVAAGDRVRDDDGREKRRRGQNGKAAGHDAKRSDDARATNLSCKSHETRDLCTI